MYNFFALFLNRTVFVIVAWPAHTLYSSMRSSYVNADFGGFRSPNFFTMSINLCICISIFIIDIGNWNVYAKMQRRTFKFEQNSCKLIRIENILISTTFLPT